MASPDFSARRAFLAAIVFLTLTVAIRATTFPLPTPTRPTKFPLERPTLAGEVVAWGKNDFQQIPVPPGLTNVVAISAMENFTVALRSDGTVTAWGDNQVGQTNVPAGLSNVVAVSAGRQHAIALKADGTVVCWGVNLPSVTKVPPGLSDVVAVSAGDSHTVVLKANGTIVNWGSSNWGPSPMVSYYPNGYSEPPLRSPPTNVVAISAGGISCALLSDNRIISWGVNLENYGTTIIAVTQVREGAEIASILSAHDLILLRRDGVLSPSGLIPLGVRPVAIAEGYASEFTMALNGDGTVSLWAWSWYLKAPVVAATPPRLRGVIAIAAGQNHAVVVKLPTPPVPTTAVASAQLVNGFVVGLNVIDAGEGYAVPPKVTITGGGGIGAAATAQISRGVVTGFTITNAGLGYTTAPTIEIESPTFLPSLSIATSRVGVTMLVVPGKRYQLESSSDLPNFGPVGAVFEATEPTVTQEFAVNETGRFFRIVEVP